MKVLLFVSMLLFGQSFSEFSKGIYATHRGDTAICLELMDDQRFKMILSTCNEDKIEEGKYRLTKGQILLVSDDVPKMEIKNFRPADSKLGNGIILRSADKVLLSQCKLSYDDGKTKFNFPYQNTPLAFERNLTIYYKNLEPIVIKKPFAEDITTWQAEIQFENMNSTFAEFESWSIVGKKLKLNNSTEEVFLKKKKKCWLY